MQTSLTYLESAGQGQAALRIVAPNTDTRTPSHFIALIDVSESMSDNNKLGHVKHCLSLLLKFLQPTDEISVVSFGNESQIILRRLHPTVEALPVAEQRIGTLETAGCTNLSAGLASVRELLEESVESPLKPGLLVLTDGHANRGITDAGSLRTVVNRIHELYPAVSMSFVGYGTDHNGALLKSMAEETMGSYSLVESLEGAALTMGDALGGIISCTAQNVVIQCPAGAVVEGPYTITEGRINLGDVYAGSETLILLNLPPGPVSIRGAVLPLLDTFEQTVAGSLDTGRNVLIELTRLRYRCADLFKKIRTAQANLLHITVAIQKFRDDLEDPVFAGHPITEMLLTELQSLDAAIREATYGVNTQLQSQLLQHEAFTSLGRGTSHGIHSRAMPDAEETANQDPVEPLQANNTVSYMSPTSSRARRQLAATMSALSQQGGGAQ